MSNLKLLRTILRLKSLKITHFRFMHRDTELHLAVKPYKNGCRCPDDTPHEKSPVSTETAEYRNSLSRCMNRKCVIFRLFRRRMLRSNFRLLTGFSSFLSMPLNRGNEARVYAPNQVIASTRCLWETRIDPILPIFKCPIYPNFMPLYFNLLDQLITFCLLVVCLKNDFTLPDLL